MSNFKKNYRQNQLGASIIELLVGIAIGLLVILAAMGTIVMTRASGGTVADASLMVSQGNNAMRLIGFYLRQTGTIELLPSDPAAAVGARLFEFSNLFDGVNGTGFAVQGTEGGAAPDTLTISQENRGGAVTRDCLGAASPVGVNRVQTAFTVTTTAGVTTLNCLGSGNAISQPVAENVEDFQVMYWVQTGTGAAATQQQMNATQVQAAAAWNNVIAVNVCLQVRGEQTGNPVIAGTTFANCQGGSTARDARLHQVFRSTYNLRSQGQ